MTAYSKIQVAFRDESKARILRQLEISELKHTHSKTKHSMTHYDGERVCNGHLPRPVFTHLSPFMSLPVLVFARGLGGVSLVFTSIDNMSCCNKTPVLVCCYGSASPDTQGITATAVLRSVVKGAVS